MSKEQLQKVVNEHGYTKEECKLLDESAKTIFYNTLADLEMSKSYYISAQYEIREILKMTDGRYALLLNEFFPDDDTR